MEQLGARILKKVHVKPKLWLKPNHWLLIAKQELLSGLIADVCHKPVTLADSNEKNLTRM